MERGGDGIPGFTGKRLLIKRERNRFSQRKIKDRMTSNPHNQGLNLNRE